MSSTQRNSQGRPPMGGGPRGGMGASMGERPKDFVGSLKKLITFSKKYMGFIILAIVLSIIAAACSLLGPSQLSKITQIITEGLQTGIDTQAVQDIAVFLLSIYVVSFVCGLIQGNIMSVMSQKINKDLRSAISDKINKLPLSYFDVRSYGDTLSRVTNDVDTIGQTINRSLSSLISGIFTFVGAIILMYATNAIMATAGIVASLLGFSLMSVIIKSSQKYFRAQQEGLGVLNGHIEETYSGHTVITAYNAQKYNEGIFDSNNNNLFNSAWKSQFISGLMMPIMMFVGNLSYVTVCVVGAVLAINGSIGFEVIVAFMIYIRLFTQPLSTLAQSMTTFQTTAAASERVFNLLEEDELSNESNKTKELNNVKGEVEFENVKFGYAPEKLIIKDFSAKIKAGDKVAIVGPTGAGKTTLVNLLMRFYEVNSGSIKIDGVSIQDISREELHEKFAMVLQDTWTFQGSVKENIAYNLEDVMDEEIIKACKATGIHRTIKTLSKGYDTIMSEGTFSQGEKQLLTIARAMVKKSDLLILDEATSSVDTRTEILIQTAMDELSKEKTSFIIAHRLSTIKNADVILVMNEGNVLESGNHEELMAKGGFYANLYNSQFDEAV